MTLTWLLLILAALLIVLGALRFEVLLARWRELVGPPAGMVPPIDAAAAPPPHNTGLHPHNAPTRKPAFHRSGRRH
jgi:hypothetical protein